MKTVVVAILNPQSDRGRTAKLAESLRDALGTRFELRLLQTAARGEATSLARDAAATGCDVVVAIGGDGTVHEVANGLMSLPASARPTLAVLPAGSGNDVAFALGVTHDLRSVAAMIESNATRMIDVGHVTASGLVTLPRRLRSCYCINNVGLLLEGEINRRSHQLSWPRGSGLYLRAMLQTLWRPLPAATLQLIVDGNELTRTATILSIGNGPRSGGKFQLLPDAALDDGVFDYILALPVSRWTLLRNVRRVLAGKEVEGDWLERGRFRRMSIRANIPLVAHVDGEPWLAPSDDVRELAIEVLPRVLRVLCP